jgi:hypothetical protein
MMSERLFKQYERQLMDKDERIAQLEAENERLMDVDNLAQIIRIVDGSNTLGAGALAEAIIDALAEQEQDDETE